VPPALSRHERSQIGGKKIEQLVLVSILAKRAPDRRAARRLQGPSSAPGTRRRLYGVEGERLEKRLRFRVVPSRIGALPSGAAR